MNVHGGQYTQNNLPGMNHQCHDIEDGYRHLLAHVLSRAFADSQECDAPKCHPNTRLAVLQDIMNWIALSDHLTWFMWVFGAAGAGKSAIARSIVEKCLEQELVIARFFFFRADNMRDTLAHVVATLAYQLIQQLPELDPIISARVRFHPLVFQDSLEIQLRKLVFEPLTELHRNSPITKAIVLLLDGVDELHGEKNQTMLIQLLHKFIASNTVPVVALFFSRAELHIQGEFRSQNINSITSNLALDHKYLPNDDIRRYLQDSFADIKEKHAFRRFLPDVWPPSEAVDELVTKASGQFIFAATVAAYISGSRANPAKQLEIILGIRPVPGSHAPFAQLDALYRYLFSQVADIERVMPILATFILQSRTTYLTICAELHGLTVEEIEVALADLTSIVECRDGDITFLHASLADFLLDQHRAGAYFIDKTEWCTRLSVLALSTPLTAPLRGEMLSQFIEGAKPNPVLRQAVIDVDYYNWYMAWHICDYVDALQKMDFGDGGEAYRHAVNHLIGNLVATYPHYLEDICNRHRASDDCIRQFLVSGLSDIAKNHPFRWMLPEGWPDNEILTELVANASGQFLYAYVALQEISKPRSSPAVVLENIRHIRPPHGDHDILAPLDALYRYLLSQVFDLDLSVPFLAASVIFGEAQLFNKSLHQIDVSMADLPSIITEDSIRTSFKEFLCDQTRSLQYHVDLGICGAQLAVKQLQHNIHPDLYSLYQCLRHAVPTSELREAILNANHDIVEVDYSLTLNLYLGELRNKNFDDGGEVYRKELQRYTRWAHANDASCLEDISKSHDIAAIMESIEQEERELDSPDGIPGEGEGESDSEYQSAESGPEDD